MYNFEVGVAARRSVSPEVRHFVEAASMQEAIEKVTHQSGGADVALVTFAHYSPSQQAGSRWPSGRVDAEAH